MGRFALLFACACFAQEGIPRFEVASVKAVPANDHRQPRFRGGPGSDDPGALYVTNSTLSMLIMRAYGVRRFQFVAPSWMDTARFDIAAKLPEGTTKDQAAMMLRQLLAERFSLRVHSETRRLSVYELKVAKGGPGITPVSDDSPGLRSEEIQKASRSQWPPIPDEVLRGGTMRVFSGDGATIFIRKQTMSQFAAGLYIDAAAPGSLDRPVVDRTGLSGIYSFDLSWNQPARSTTPDVELGVPLIAVIQQRLGLKLEPGKAAIEFLVVDGASHVPTGN